MPAFPRMRLNNSDFRTLGNGALASSESSLFEDGAQASAAIDPGVGVAAEAVFLAGSGMVFNNTYGSGVSAAFKLAIIAAEAFFQSHFTDAVTINVNFDLASLGSQFSGRNTFSPLQHVAYTTLTAALSAHATTADDLAAVRSLPAADPTGGVGFAVSVGMARNLGLVGGGSGVDDNIILNSDMAWTFGPDAVGVLEHEISEGALGRVGGVGVQNSWWGPMDLFRYAAANQHDYTGGRDGLASFFSVDGTTMLMPFHNSLSTAGVFDGQDFSDWASEVSGDAFGPGGPNAPGTMTPTDLRVMDILGWTPSGTAPTPTANFTVLDTITNATTLVAGEPYAGPVAGLEHQYISITADSLNITSSVPNAFIHGGPGMDGIDVSKANGNNILDGSSGSNFLIGGTGNDGFYMDDRAPDSPIFSTIVNFHSGDNATVWGVNATDFKLTTLDNQGAAGFLGLDYIFTAPGHIDTSFVLAGYTSADLTNGRLTASYGTTADLPGLPGSRYLTIHAN